MLKKTSLISTLFLLSGCFLGDRVTPPSKAEAFFVGSTLCLTTPGSSEQQRMKGIAIEKVGDTQIFQRFLENDSEDIILKKGGCIPTFGYKFETGSAYHVTIYLTPNEKGRDDGTFSRDVYAISIVVWEDSNKIKNINLFNGG